MSTPTVEERRGRTVQATTGALRAEGLRERAAAIRRSTSRPAPSESGRPYRRVVPGVSTPKHEETGRKSGERRREAPGERGPASRRRDLQSVRERLDRARAEEMLAKVRSSEWWDTATAGDLEKARRIANASGAPASSRTAIRTEMQDVAQRRYGSSVEGAIRYERENPNQPPPDIGPHGIALKL